MRGVQATDAEKQACAPTWYLVYSITLAKSWSFNPCKDRIILSRQACSSPPLCPPMSAPQLHAPASQSSTFLLEAVHTSCPSAVHTMDSTAEVWGRSPCGRRSSRHTSGSAGIARQGVLEGGGEGRGGGGQGGQQGRVLKWTQKLEQQC